MFRSQITVVIGAMTAAAVMCHDHPAHALPGAAQFLSEIGFEAADQQRVLNGEFVTLDAAATSENDLTLSIAFLVKTSPADLSEQIIAGNIVDADPQVVASGELKSGGDLADLAALEVDAETLQAFVDARPDEALNLSAGEIAAWNALAGAEAHAKLAQLRQMLLARYQAYRASGLAGIAPYDRGSRSTNVADELRSASNALSLLRKYLPDLQQFLLNYPRATLTEMRQTFRWVQYRIDGATTLVLMHELSAAVGAARAVVQRQYYVSEGYNCEQAVAAFLPVQGGTVVAYNNHTFTDQVAGFGAGVKRSIGRQVMARKLTQMFDTARNRVAIP